MVRENIFRSSVQHKKLRGSMAEKVMHQGITRMHFNDTTARHMQMQDSCNNNLSNFPEISPLKQTGKFTQKRNKRQVWTIYRFYILLLFFFTLDENHVRCFYVMIKTVTPWRGNGSMRLRDLLHLSHAVFVAKMKRGGEKT